MKPIHENAKQRRRWKRMLRRLLHARQRREGLRSSGPYGVFLRRKHPVCGVVYRDVARWIRMGRAVAFATKGSFFFGGAREIEVFLPGDPEIVESEKRFVRLR